MSATQFRGYLLKFGNTILPHEYIQLDTYQSIPNQRIELSAYRDSNTDLHRVTSQNYKTTIKFDTMPLTLAQKIDLQTKMRAGLVNATERKYQVNYWNDEDNQYDTKYFYIPAVAFPIHRITENDIQYNPVSFEFIQY